MGKNKVAPGDFEKPFFSVNLVEAALLELELLKEADDLKEFLTNPDILKVAIYR